MKIFLLIGSQEFIEKFFQVYKNQIKNFQFETLIINDSKINLNDIKCDKFEHIIYLFPLIDKTVYEFFNQIHLNGKDVTYFFNLDSINIKFKDSLIFGIPHISINQINRQNFLYSTFERFVALIALILLLPLLIIVSILIVINDGFPIFFTQNRLGLDGKKFIIYKFRTLRNSTPKYMKSSEKTRNYYTEIGLSLRKSNIDELPQLLNVLNGTMSFIGPRPEMPFIADDYNFVEKIRLQVKPGLSGLWQLSQAREREIHHNLEHDFNYIKNKNFVLDIKLFIKTAIKSFR